jgi:hypothetical protein
MSVVPTTNPFYNYSNFLNTAFTITQNGIFLKITFAAPISLSFQLNEKLFNIKYSELGANYVDLGEFDWGILTVNYALCTSPVAGSRQAWIDAVVALITTAGGSNIINSLAASSQTDVVVGWNSTTRQLTNLGNAPRERFYVYQSGAQAVAQPSPGTRILFNVVLDDPLSMYSAATGLATIPETGYYIFGMSLQISAPGAFAYITRNGATATDGYSWTGFNQVPTTSFGFWCTAGDTIGVMAYGSSGARVTSPLGQILNFWGKRIV